PGRVLFRRFAENPGLWTVLFTGAAIDLGRAMLVDSSIGSFDVTDEGTLLMMTGSLDTRLEVVWLDRKGAVVPIAGAPFLSGGSSPALAPDGRRVALQIGSEGSSVLVVRDVQTGADTPLTVRDDSLTALRPGATAALRRPTWFPSGDRLVEATGALETRIEALQADGSGTARDLTAARFGRVSRDGRYLLAVVDDR